MLDLANKYLHFHLGLHLPLILNPSIQCDLLPHMSRTQLSTSVGPNDKTIEVLNKNNKIFHGFCRQLRQNSYRVPPSSQYNLDIHKEITSYIPNKT